MDHSQKIKNAKDAINEVFVDSSVSKKEVQNSLEDLLCDMDVMIESLDNEQEDENS